MAFDQQWVSVLREKLEEPPSKQFDAKFWASFEKKTQLNRKSFPNYARLFRLAAGATILLAVVGSVLIVVGFSPSREYASKAKSRRPASKKPNLPKSPK